MVPNGWCLSPVFGCVLYGVALILGLFSGFIPTIVFASAPLFAKRKETIGIAMSIVIIGENAGILIGPEIFGYLREWTGTFTASFWTLSIASILMMIASLKIWKSGVFAKLDSGSLTSKEEIRERSIASSQSLN